MNSFHDQLPSFAQPLWLLAGALVIGLIILLRWRLANATRDQLKTFAAEHLLENLTRTVSTRRRKMKAWMFLTATIMGFLALARPQYGFHWEEAKRKGIDILFAIDTSRSMLAQDVNPDRLTRAKLAVVDLLSKLEGDRVGLIAFAGEAFLQSPLTLDYDAFRQSLDAIDTSVIPKGGTDVASAIEEADRAFKQGTPSHKILILITDGEDLQGNGISVARAAAEGGMKVFTVGVGTATGELIPFRNDSGGVQFLKDDKGQVIKSRLDEEVLRQIADSTGGFYEPLGQQGEGLEAIYERGLSPIPKEELTSRMTKIYIERFQWPLGLAIFFLTCEMLLGDRRRKENLLSMPLWRGRKALLIPFCLTALTFGARASPQSAERAYQKGSFEKAEEEYRKADARPPGSATLKFNLGSSEYRGGKFEAASASFQRALHTEEVELQEQAYYNLGNTQYRLGQATEKDDAQKTIQQWQQALQSYQSALQLKKDDGDAKFNYEFVKKKLEELQKQQPPPKPEEQPKDNPDSKDSKDKDPEKDPKNPNDSKDPKKTDDKKDPSEGKDPNKSEKDKSKNPEDGKSGSQPDNKEGSEPKPQPGQMTKEDARNLLDSLKGDEKKMPVVPVGVEKRGQPEQPQKDW